MMGKGVQAELVACRECKAVFTIDAAVLKGLRHPGEWHCGKCLQGKVSALVFVTSLSPLNESSKTTCSGGFHGGRLMAQIVCALSMIVLPRPLAIIYSPIMLLLPI